MQRTTAEPPNTRHFGDDINSADLFFVERLSSLGGSKCIVGITLGHQVMSFVERFTILCLHWEGPLYIPKATLVATSNQSYVRSY